MTMRNTIALFFVLAACACGQQIRPITQYNDINKVGSEYNLKPVQWFAGDSIRFDVYASNVRTPLILTGNCFAVLFVAAETNVAQVYMAQTGTVVSATNGHVRVSVPSTNALLSPSIRYSAWMTVYRVASSETQEVATVAYSAARVIASPFGTQYAYTGPYTNTPWQINVTLGAMAGADTGAVRKVGDTMTGPLLVGSAAAGGGALAVYSRSDVTFPSQAGTMHIASEFGPDGPRIVLHGTNGTDTTIGHTSATFGAVSAGTIALGTNAPISDWPSVTDTNALRKTGDEMSGNLIVNDAYIDLRRYSGITTQARLLITGSGYNHYLSYRAETNAGQVWFRDDGVKIKDALTVEGDIRVTDPDTNVFVLITVTGGLQVGRASFKALPSGDISQDATNNATLGALSVGSIALGTNAAVSNWPSSVSDSSALSTNGGTMAAGASIYFDDGSIGPPRIVQSGRGLNFTYGNSGPATPTDRAFGFIDLSSITYLADIIGRYDTEAVFRVWSASLGGTSNLLSDDGSQLTYNGVAIGTGGGGDLSALSNNLAAVSNDLDAVKGYTNRAATALQTVVYQGSGNVITGLTTGGTILTGQLGTVSGGSGATQAISTVGSSVATSTYDAATATLSWSNSATAGAGGGATGLVFVSRYLLTNNESSVTFTNLPQTFDRLQFRALVHSLSTTAGAGDIMAIRINGDTNAIYGHQGLSCIAGSSLAENGGAGTSTYVARPIHNVGGVYTAATYRSFCDVTLVNYTNTTQYKHHKSMYGSRGYNGGLTGYINGYYEGTAAIHSVTFILLNPATGTNFMANACEWEIYGETE